MGISESVEFLVVVWVSFCVFFLCVLFVLIFVSTAPSFPSHLFFWMLHGSTKVLVPAVAFLSVKSQCHSGNLNILLESNNREDNELKKSPTTLSFREFRRV